MFVFRSSKVTSSSTVPVAKHELPFLTKCLLVYLKSCNDTFAYLLATNHCQDDNSSQRSIFAALTKIKKFPKIKDLLVLNESILGKYKDGNVFCFYLGAQLFNLRSCNIFPTDTFPLDVFRHIWSTRR